MFYLKQPRARMVAVLAWTLLLKACVRVDLPIKFQEKAPRVRANTVLILEDYGTLEENNRGIFSITRLGRQNPTLLDLIYSLRKAAVDERIRGVVLKMEEVKITPSQAQDLREAILHYRKSGKPIVSYASQYDDLHYFIASACAKVYMMPYGLMSLKGFSGTRTYWRGLLEKLGIAIETVRFGEYKNAPDAFTEESMSAAEKEQLTAFFNVLYKELITVIAKDRGLAPSRVSELIDKGIFGFADDLVQKGLIDGLLNFDEVIATFSGKGFSPVQTLSHQDYRRIPAKKLGLNSGPDIALVYINGTITSGRDSTNPLSGSYNIGADSLIRCLEEVRKNPKIKAVILRVDSPGGNGLASEAIAREIGLVKKDKPVVVSMGTYAASGGYYIAAPADVIVAEPTTLTGSIGVFMIKPDFSGLYSKIGIHRETVKSGENADLFSIDRPMSPAEKERALRLVGDFYQRFIQLIVQERRMTSEKIVSIAGGRIWSGADAKQIGLIDELGGLLKAVDIAKEKAHIAPSQEVSLDIFPRLKNSMESLLGLEGRKTVSLWENLSPLEIADIQPLLWLLEADPMGKASPFLALLPFTLDIH